MDYVGTERKLEDLVQQELQSYLNSEICSHLLCRLPALSYVQSSWLGCRNEDYQYEALSTNLTSIRLLQILPGSDQDVIKCTIKSTKIGVRPYHALSYMWGPYCHN